MMELVRHELEKPRIVPTVAKSHSTKEEKVFGEVKVAIVKRLKILVEEREREIVTELYMWMKGTSHAIFHLNNCFSFSLWP